MAIKMVSTGTIIKMYLEENKVSAAEAAEASNVSLRTILRVLNDESKLSADIAIGLNRLLPEISAEYLLSYDSQYQLQKKIVEKTNNDISISKVLIAYQMKKLYKDLANDEISLFEKTKNVFGLDNIINDCYIDVDDLSYCFSLANGERNNHLIWLKAAYEDCKKSSDYLALNFDQQVFDKNFDSLKGRTFTNDLRTTIYNMKSFCKRCGINFYYRPSIPGARVKAVAVKDKEGKVFIFVSDLFKCIENLWLAFIHECEHIKNKDFEKQANVKKDLIDSSIDENYIDEKAIEFFIGNDYAIDNMKNINYIIALAERTKSPVSIVTEIARFKNNNYVDSAFNKYIHYYKSGSILDER